ncbi:MAG: 2-C-methyl-D-erythritol 2,4-cyclodiphosphate synthase [Candidatus Omnitrophica bacterium CG08_land_8_20_14_0_20_41_16]|uniref:2-C-methyl-D-erythritol 2,4-cyclodiphosphate synthase n=1 Tax=Candidatus Sherwoodlollariibacterium unditelluris TaxID=1974757 RepID=A0A2G9YKP2_9BACT|nr:MAG: 2-C-methyl-D-erythritol 2,4-cyclodiphosphate synthase [Candidatus Omnitrophica bacterium CG23_combo_of_CG06-09_8_20_14_all_41_10]PIS34405.1 MAG: 2-C-methyl-D-erythritol 2,4-cyclodiphosphate synthase [Candidatus Omnitrophica bacterium CG08_land_8_20_14_0_20_41_16]
MGHRIGIGYDIHRLVDGRKLFIGGIEIPYVKGLLGHSDGDVLLHAISDALLGALSAGDIGEHFPDTDPKYQGASSMELLKSVLGLVSKKGYNVCNIDAVIIAQEPAMAPFKKKIRENLACALKVDKDCVSIKAKTNEGMGETGRKEAIACYVVALLKKPAP